MSMIDWSLAIAALVVAGLAWHVPRAVLWVVAAAVSFTISTIYWRLNGPYAEAVGGFCDAGVVLAIYFIAKQKWEMAMWRLFQTSVAINFVYLGGNLGIFPHIDHELFSAFLEAINWLALLMVGGMGLMQRFGIDDVYAHRSRRGLRGALHSLRAQRKHPSFLRAHS